MKQKLYNLIAHFGIWFLHKFFPEYFAVEPLKPTDRYIEYPFVLKNLPKNPIKILDVGCSGSMFPLILNALGYEVFGIDIRNYYPSNQFFFVKGDIRVNMFEENTFDVVTAISSIEHIGLQGVYGQEEELDGDMKALNEIYRILKPNGILLMTIPCGIDLQITNNHKIYNMQRIELLLNKFIWQFEYEESPEADYKIILIKAIK